MATVITGINGSATLPSGINILTDSWSLVLEQAPVETTTYADSGNRTYRGALRGASGSASGFVSQGSGAAIPGWGATASATTIAGGGFQTPVAMTLSVEATNTCTYGFDAVATNIRVDHTVQGQVRFTFDFVASGAITETWDVT